MNDKEVYFHNIQLHLVPSGVFCSVYAMLQHGDICNIFPLMLGIPITYWIQTYRGKVTMLLGTHDWYTEHGDTIIIYTYTNMPHQNRPMDIAHYQVIVPSPLSLHYDI